MVGQCNRRCSWRRCRFPRRAELAVYVVSSRGHLVRSVAHESIYRIDRLTDRRLRSQSSAGVTSLLDMKLTAAMTSPVGSRVSTDRGVGRLY